MATTIAVCNQKGGVAKTSTAIALAAGLGQKGSRILLIDTDSQPGNLSLAVGADKDGCCGTYELFKAKPGTIDIHDLIQTVEVGDVIAANDALQAVEGELMTAISREQRLRCALAPVQDNYDYIIIDTPPALNVFTINALVAANEVIIPTPAGIDEVAGMEKLLENVESVKALVNSELKVAGILLTKYQAATTVHQEVSGAINCISENYGVKVFDTRIKQTVSIQTARRHGADPVTFDSRSLGSMCYNAFIDEYLNASRQ